MLEENPSGDEAADGGHANINRNCNVVLRVRVHCQTRYFQLLSHLCHSKKLFQEEVLDLPLTGVEAILSSNDLQVASKNAVYDFVLKWARIQYPKLEERRLVLATQLARLIRIPYMSCRKLKKVLTCNDFDHEVAAKLVLEATFFKAEAPHSRRVLAAESTSSGGSFVERAYKYRPL